MKLDESIARLLHEHYRNLRKMLRAGVPKRGVKKSFEELVYSVIAKNSWRPTHISSAAIQAYVDGSPRSIQRAHGVLGDRLDRYERIQSHRVVLRRRRRRRRILRFREQRLGRGRALSPIRKRVRSRVHRHVNALRVLCFSRDFSRVQSSRFCG